MCGLSSLSGANFNPRSHEGSDAIVSIPLLTHSGFQSALPRGERRNRLNSSTYPFGISIRAPTRGATPAPITNSTAFSVFQSALPRGERLPYKYYNTILTYFNPRSHEGSDDAPGRSVSAIYDFNPRSHEGSDMSAQMIFL